MIARFRLALVAAMSCTSAALILVAACGGGGTVVDPADPRRASAVISAEGGRIDGPLGSFIVVPAGALDADTPMAIEIADDSTYTPLPDGAIARGAVFAFTPHGLMFALPAQIGIPSSSTADEVAPVLRAADLKSPWTLGPTPVFDDARLATFQTSQLSLYTVVGTGDGGLDAIFPGGPGCTPDLRDQKWVAMLASPIVLPGRVGTLDLAGADKAGITRAEAEAALCAGVSRGAVYGDDTETIGWGADGDFAIAFDKGTGRARFGVATGAYTGGLELAAAPDPDAGAADGGDGGAGGYVIKLGTPLAKGGAPVTIPWADGAALGALMDDLERAMLSTYFPGEPLPTTSCTAAPVRCSPGALGNAGYLSFAALGLTLWVGDTKNADRASTPSRLDVYPLPSP